MTDLELNKLKYTLIEAKTALEYTDGQFITPQAGMFETSMIKHVDNKQKLSEIESALKLLDRIETK